MFLINLQCLFDHCRQLLTDFAELFELQIRRQFPGHFLAAQRQFLVSHIQQTVGIGMGQCPWVVEIVLHRLTQTLGEHPVLVHVDRGTDKFVHVAVVANPQVDSLLAPTDDAVELALQVEHQLIDEAQLRATQCSILNAQQVGLQLVACRFQSILQFTQGA
ncbi:hypothetical protein D3C78_1276740 [compost metagenome]